MKNKMLKLKQSAISDYLPLIIAFAIIVAFFGIMAPNFFAVRNFLNILLYAANVAFLSGINVDLTLIGVFALNGLVTGIATLVYCSQLGAGMPQNATGMEFDVITAVVLGGTSMSGGKGTIVGALIGAILIGTLENGMVMMNINSYWQDVISGIVLVIAVVFDIIKNRGKS